MWDEKKSEKMHIRLTPKAASAARESAVDDRRSVQDQLGVLVEEALQTRGYLRKGKSDRNEGSMPLDAAQNDLPLSVAGPIAAQRRTMSRKRA